MATGMSTSAVPRSGCRTTRTNGTARMANVTSTPLREDDDGVRHVVSAHASTSTKTSLKSSDGWNVSGPRWIQRRAPETVRPRMNTVRSRATPIT